MAIRLGIAPPKDALPTCTPNLMPFHINYSGPALISTYMQVEPSHETVGAPAKSVEDPTTSAPQTNENEGDNVGGIQSLEVDASQTEPVVVGASKRFISSFRGRTIHGLDIDLPEGYGGLILRTEGHGANSTSATSSTRHEEADTTKVKRVTRRSKRIVARDDAGEVELEMSEKVVQEVEIMDLTRGLDEDDFERLPTQMLIPTAQFSSFRLWNPDIPADEGADEYTRSLTEWTRLAHHIHQVPP
ncbi:hypothetical protein AX15_000385 [Amanita polypyramis BW_CC]|nr:hypothetical protein AX15_000385 [Amanita polypyramis BW_CC]